MTIEIRKSFVCATALTFLLVSVSANAVTVFVQYDGSTILSDPASVSNSGSDFDVSANLQAGEFKGRAEGANTTDQNAYTGSLQDLVFTNNTGGVVVIGAGDFVAHVQGDYTFGTGPNQTIQVNNGFQVRINGGAAILAGARHNLAVGYALGGSPNTFTPLFEFNGAEVVLTTASVSQLIMDLVMPELTLMPGDTMAVAWNNSPTVNTSATGGDPSSFAEFDFLTGANGMTFGLVLPAGVTLDSDSTVPLDWVTNVPVPGAVWLFGSALGLLGWMRRKAT
jgi:hypothetical protein